MFNKYVLVSKSLVLCLVSKTLGETKESEPDFANQRCFKHPPCLLVIIVKHSTCVRSASARLIRLCKSFAVFRNPHHSGLIRCSIPLVWRFHTSLPKRATGEQSHENIRKTRIASDISVPPNCVTIEDFICTTQGAPHRLRLKAVKFPWQMKEKRKKEENYLKLKTTLHLVSQS